MPTAYDLNICPRCGLPVRTDGSFSMEWNAQGGLYYRHTTCPTSAALASLPAVDAARAGDLPYQTIAEAAHLLRVSSSTIRARIRRRLLPAWRLRGGQTVLVRRADVEGLLVAVQGTGSTPVGTDPQDHRKARLDAPAHMAQAGADMGEANEEGIGPEPPLCDWPSALLTRRASDVKGNYPGGLAALKAEEAELNRRSSAKPWGDGHPT